MDIEQTVVAGFSQNRSCELEVDVFPPASILEVARPNCNKFSPERFCDLMRGC